ncbi:lipopolysaccharide transport periplasmic protein LptA [Vitreoscilla stercoraria]|nr:lipopolysaccharide transport periplasmic protein LptA [Vitreoscilla sp. C1]
MMSNLKFKYSVALLTCALAAPVWALQSDQNQPISIEADNGVVDQGKQVTVFSGNVVVKQGSIDIRASKIEVSRTNDSNQIMTATGSPVTFKQQLDGGKGWVNGQGQKVTYQSASGLVTLSGGAKVQRGGDMVQGNNITYNTKTEIYTAAGSKSASGSDRRVTVILQPSSTQK